MHLCMMILEKSTKILLYLTNGRLGNYSLDINCQGYILVSHTEINNVLRALYNYIQRIVPCSVLCTKLNIRTCYAKNYFKS